MVDDTIDTSDWPMPSAPSQGAAPTNAPMPMGARAVMQPRLPKYWDTEDVAKGVGSGIVRGAEDIAGMAKDIPQFLGNVWEYGVQKGAQALGYQPPGGPDVYKRGFGDIAAENARLTQGVGMPSSEEIKEKVIPSVSKYQPTSQWGERAQAGTESAVANLPGGMATAPARMGAGAVGGIAGQTVRQNAEGSPYQPYLGVAADLAAQAATVKVTGFRPSAAGAAQSQLDAALSKDFAAGQAKIPYDQLQSMLASGAPLSYADIGGPNVQALLKKSMSRIPETGVPNSVQNYNESLNKGQLGGPDATSRLNDSQKSLNTVFSGTAQNGLDPASLTDAIERSKKAEVGKLYDIARDPQNVRANSLYMSSIPDQIRENPHLHDAMKDAASLVKGELDPTAYSVPGLNSVGAETPGNIAYWDLTKRSLDKRYNQLVARGDSQDMLRANQIDDVRNVLKSYLDNEVPDYGTARGVSQSYFKAESAPEAGMNFYGNMNSFDKNDALKNFSSYTPEQKGYFKTGFMGSMNDEIGRPNGLSSVSRKFTQDADFQNKAKMVLGADYDRVKTSILGENIYNSARQMGPAGGSHITGISTAAGLLAGGAPAAYDAISSMAFNASMLDPKYLALAGVGATVGAVGAARAKAIAQRVADYAARGDMNGLSNFAAKEPAASYLVEDLNRRFQAVNQQGQYTPEDRAGRATGGRTSKTGASAKNKAIHLISMVDQVRKDEGKATSTLLNLDDTTVAKALAIANKQI